MIKIAIVDVAADSSGALSVLMDFYSYVKNEIKDTELKFYFFTSVVNLQETENIVCIKKASIKKSWLHRLAWEYFEFPAIHNQEQFDLIFSLQNKTMPVIDAKQIVYFHNSLHLADKKQFSFFKKYDRAFWIYTHLITPITLNSLKKAICIITQTNSVKKRLERKVNTRIEAIYPDTDIIPQENDGKIKGFIYPAAPLSYKHMEYIIDAERKIYEKCNHEIIFTASGNENEYAAMIKNSAAGMDNIKFIGWQTREKIMDMYHEYGLIFTSSIESFPIPFAEAMSYGVPIVAVNEDYAVEILDGYENKVLCEPNGLSDSIIEGMKHKIENGHKISSDNLGSSWNKVIALILENLNYSY